jgi:hypothetical protein
MTELRYAHAVAVSVDRAEAAFAGDDDDAIAEALIGCALDATVDRPWLETSIEKLANHKAVSVRRVAATALGHVARVHGSVNRALADRILGELRKDASTRGAANDAAEDVERFSSV